METPNGTKRIAGFVIMALSIVLPYFGIGLSEVAPAEMARFADAITGIVGAALLIYGEYKAKAPLWFSGVHKEGK